MVRVPLPMADVWAEIQAQVEELTGQAGIQILRAILENEALSIDETVGRQQVLFLSCGGKNFLSLDMRETAKRDAAKVAKSDSCPVSAKRAPRVEIELD